MQNRNDILTLTFQILSSAVYKATFLTVALMAFLSCNKHEIAPVNPETEIRFGSVTTRAGEVFNGAQEFSVWAVVSSDDYLIDDVALSYHPWMTNERVYETGNGWTYDNTSYWLPNSKFWFFATYPYNSGVNVTRQSQGGVIYTLYSLNVSADGSTDTKDILIASNIIDTGADAFDADDLVELNFSHLLTKFNLTISQNTGIDSEFEYYVTKVSITGLNDNGVYMIMPYENQFLSAWNMDEATPMTLSKNYEINPICLREDYGTGRKSRPLKVWGEDGVMLIPHEIVTNGVMIRIDYLYDVNPDDEDYGEAKFIEGYIPPIIWQSNTSINYNIAIANSSFLTFDQPTIEQWGSPQTGGTIIIK